MKGYLLLSDGTKFSGTLFGSCKPADGEVVFNTGMVGYEQSLTDPSYRGQILTFTYPLIGNYGIPGEERDEQGLKKFFESDEVHVRGIILSTLSEDYSHHSAEKSLDTWLKEKNICGISEIDTRALTQKLREHGVLLGQIVAEDANPLKTISDPNENNLVAEVSCPEIKILEPTNSCGITIAALDFGIKNNILRSFLKRGVRIIQCPWDTDLSQISEKIDGVFLSNGPGDPERVAPTVAPNISWAEKENIPLFGICLGNQILSLSVGAKTYKMKYGHRSLNQPCLDVIKDRALITSQNHGYAVDEKTIPDNYELWFQNLNDGTSEGIRHKTKPLSSVQFHPEACAGPEDSNYLFDEFLQSCKKEK